MNFTIVNTLILLGTIQGVIFGVVILTSKKYRNVSSYFLVTLILAASYNNFQYYLTDIGFMTINEVYKTIYLPVASLIPAVIYFYVYTLINPLNKISGLKRMLFLPFVSFFSIVTYYKIGTLFNFLSESQLALIAAVPTLHEIISFLFLSTILVFSIRVIQIARRNVKKYTRELVQPKLSWLFWIVILLFLINIIYGYSIVLMISNTEENTAFYTVWVANSFLIYILGHIGIYKYGIQKERRTLRSYAAKHKSFSVSEKPTNEHIVTLEKIIIDEKLYLNPLLSLDYMATRLHLSKSHLSRIINVEMQQSFSEYINKHRVTKAKAYLSNPDFKNYTIVAIGLEAGFNSKTTFNTSFKKYTGFTPTQFRKKNT